MESTRLLDSRWALVAGTALSTAAVCAAASSYINQRRSARAAGAASTAVTSPEKGEDEEEDKEKRFEVQKEYYNSQTGSWDSRDEGENDKSRCASARSV